MCPGFPLISRFKLALLLVLGLCTLAPRALSQPAAAPIDGESPTWLVWAAPDNCSTGDEVRLRLEEWFGRPLPFEETLRARATTKKNETSWLLEFELEYEQTRGRRLVPLSDCSEAAEIVALTIALAVDPSAIPALGEPPFREDEGAATSSTRASASTALEENRPPEEKASPLEEHQPSEPQIIGNRRPTSVTPLEDPPPTPPTTPRWSASLDARIMTGIFPSPAIGAQAQVALEGRAWRASVGGLALPPAPAAFTEDELSVEMRLAAWGGAVEICRVFSASRHLQFSPCAALIGGRVLITQTLPNGSHSGGAWWSGLTLGGEMGLRITDRIGWQIGLSGVGHLVRPALVVPAGNGQDDREAITVHEASGNGFSAKMGGRIFF